MTGVADTTQEQLLVIEDDRATRANLRDILELDGYCVRTAGSIREAKAMPGWCESAVVILDRRLPDGLAEQNLPELTAAALEATFIIVTGHHDLDGAIACLKQGAEDYILKPLNADVLRTAIRRALEHRRARAALKDAEARLRQTLDELEKRVEERTAELARANAVLRDEIAVRMRTENELMLLRDLALLIASEPSLDDAMRQALQRICDSTGWGCGEAWLADEGATVFQLRAHWSRDESLREFHEASKGMSFERGRGLPGRVWATRKPVWVGNLNDKRQFSRAGIARSCGLVAGLGVPIFSAEKLVAVVTFFLRDRRPEDRRLVQLVAAAAAPLGPVIERKRIEDQLARHKEHLEQLVAERTSQLRQADRLASIGTLAAGLGHDMHNVLLPMRSRLDVMEADDLPARSRDQLAPIRRAIAYLQELSDGLHLLALDPTDDDATLQTTDLNEWWSQVGSLLGRTLPRRIAFQCVIEPDLPEVRVAPHRLTQAILNLLVNAGEAIADEGEVRLKAQRHPSRLDVVRISVSDTGEGMTDEVKQRALDPFFTTKKRGLGTGLGLSLVHGVVKQAGGTIDIESEPGKQTILTMLLPVRTSMRGAGASEPPRATVSVQDPRVAGFLGTFLAAAGFDIAPAEDGLPRNSSLWIVDPAVARFHTVKRFLRISRRRRVIVVGQTTDEWRALGTDVVEDASDVESLRRAVGDAITAMSPTAE